MGLAACVTENQATPPDVSQTSDSVEFGAWEVMVRIRPEAEH
jgi:hypothetical protein